MKKSPNALTATRGLGVGLMIAGGYFLVAAIAPTFTGGDVKMFRVVTGTVYLLIGLALLRKRKSPRAPEGTLLPILPQAEQMKKNANAHFVIKSWDEKPFNEGQELPKMTRAVVTKTFTGDIEGEGQVEYLMMYRSDGSATFVGLERVVGKIAGKVGSFVLQRSGMFEGGVAKESYSVIPGSGTGELVGLSGEGTSAVGHGTEHPITLHYQLGSVSR